MLLPSETESFGLVALEAMACEVPVIASNVGGIPEVVRNGRDGFLVEPGDIATMATLAAEVLSDSEKQAAMGAAARQQAHENFCSDSIIARYERFYDRIIREVDC
jgi:L-malate glycosyltransferase